MFFKTGDEIIVNLISGWEDTCMKSSEPADLWWTQVCMRLGKVDDTFFAYCLLIVIRHDV